MLTVASPKVDDVGCRLRARTVSERNCRRARRRRASRRRGPRWSSRFPSRSARTIPSRQRDLIGVSADASAVSGATSSARRPRLRRHRHGDRSRRSRARSRRSSSRSKSACAPSEFHPDIWPPVVIRDPAETAAKLAAVAGDKYSYRELDDFSDLIKRTLQNVPQVSKISRAGPAQGADLPRILAGAARRAPQNRLTDILGARNITLPGGVFEVAGQELRDRSLRRVQGREGDRRRHRRHVGLGAAALPARQRGHRARLRESRPLPELLPMAGRRGQMASQPRDHAGASRCGPASRSASSARRSTRRWRACGHDLPDDLVISRGRRISRCRSARTSICSCRACTRPSRWSSWSR